MKRIFVVLSLVLFSVAAFAQQKKSVILPGKGNIDVEKLNGKVNSNMDISNLSLSELRVLRNAMSARHGYLFMSAELRSLFEQTSWYWDKMYAHLEKEYAAGGENGRKEIPVKLTPDEIKLVNRIKAREAELLKQNFKVAAGQKVNTDNIVNDYQMEFFAKSLMSKLGQNGFAIVQDKYDQLFQIYENNDYHDFPSFITTDLYLQAFHIYFDSLLRLAEESDLSDRLLGFCEAMKQLFIQETAENPDPQVQELAKWNAAYFAVAVSLLTDKPVSGIDPAYMEDAKLEVENVKAEEQNFSEFLGYTKVKFMYNLFRPRGHYTRNDQLKRYFRSMMWVQTVPFGTDKPEQLQRAALIAELMDKKGMNGEYNRLVDPITFLMGEPDNVSLLQVQNLMKQNGLTVKTLLTDQTKYDTFRKQVEELAEKQTRIKPKFLRSSEHKLNLMPQRYFPDAEVLQEMVDVENKVTKRDASKGLDYFAAMGNPAAEKILIDELKEAQRWEGFTPNLNHMKGRMATIDWNATVSNKWVSTLMEMTKGDSRYPYFMQGMAWDKKNLNAALASWAELKHDAILYGKQPVMAECGGGEVPEPIVKGYVEPNVKFWKKACDLMKETSATFKRFGIENEQIEEITEKMLEYGQFFLNVSEKELKGEKLTEEEYNQIEVTGANFEYLTLNMLNLNNENPVEAWDYVEGADKKVALVADVLTSNGDNNPNPSVLYEAVGPAYEIYVVVEIDGMLFLTRGGVFSYREFKRDVNDPRLTDEEWQKDLEEMPNEGAPVWMNDIVIPNDDMPQDNERVFYSSGC